MPLPDRLRRRSLGYATRASKQHTFADQCTAVRPQRSAQPPHRSRSTRTIDVPQLTHRLRGAQIPIAPAVPLRVPPARFPPLEAFGRRPSARAAPSIIGPASETLHNSGAIADIAALRVRAIADTLAHAPQAAMRLLADLCLFVIPARRRSLRPTSLTRNGGSGYSEERGMEIL